MKPFNLEEAIAGKPVVTTEGAAVIIAGYNANAQKNHQVVGWVDGNSYSWNEYGYLYSNNSPCEYDLHMKTEVKTIKGWMNIYYDENTSKIHPTKENADFHQAGGRIACIEVEVSYEI